jgi:protein-S-isoprenylcysteine O-methyltransferase Ste14
MTGIGRRTVAVAYGLACHTTFAVAIAVMVVGLYSGLGSGRGPFEGPWALVANLVLLAQFPLGHSFLLGRRGRRVLGRLAPGGLGEHLSTTTYALVASAQLLVLFGGWSPSGVVWWRPTGGMAALAVTVCIASWLFLGKALVDAHLALQTGYLGWSSVAVGRAPDYGTFPTHGTFRLCRQPVYLAFALVLWTGPVWTPDKLALAIPWTVYCILAPRLKERRYARRFGDDFTNYQRRVPYMVPLGPRRSDGERRAAQPATFGNSAWKFSPVRRQTSS